MPSSACAGRPVDSERLSCASLRSLHGWSRPSLPEHTIQAGGAAQVLEFRLPVEALKQTKQKWPCNEVPLLHQPRRLNALHHIKPHIDMDFGSRFWVVAALSLGPAVANSFARFAYALL